MDNQSHVWNHQPGYVLILRRMSFTHFTLDQVILKHGLLRILVLLQVTLRFVETPNSWYHSPKGKSLNCWVAALLFWDEARMSFDELSRHASGHISTAPRFIRYMAVAKEPLPRCKSSLLNSWKVIPSMVSRLIKMIYSNHRLEKSRKELNIFGVTHTQYRDYHYIYIVCILHTWIRILIRTRVILDTFLTELWDISHVSMWCATYKVIVATPSTHGLTHIGDCWREFPKK